MAGATAFPTGPVTGGTTTSDMGLQVLALAIVFFLPHLALWLPHLVFGW